LSEVKSNPESSYLVSISIIAGIVLFLVGFVYPLSFLPFEPGREIALSFEAFFTILFSFKGLMLLLPSIIFSGIMIVFFVINLRLKYSRKDIKELALATKLKYYSSYFDQMQKNEKEVDEWLRQKQQDHD
jgi:hypothetical protein